MGKTGVWGTLDYSELRLEPPVEYSEGILNSVVPQMIWRFVGFDASSLGRSLMGAGMNEEQVNTLLGASPKLNPQGWIEVVPPAELVLSLTPQVRAKVYDLLRSDPITSVYRTPYVLYPNWHQELADENQVAPSVIEMAQKLTYYRGAVACFSDVPLVLQSLSDHGEKLEFMKAVLRDRSLGVRLRVDEEADFAGIKAYWSAFGRNEGVMPILEALEARGGKGTLDLVYLLPPVPRSLIYTFADPTSERGGNRPDCFWTAGNFFNEEASSRFLDSSAFPRFLFENFEEVRGIPAFGDVVLISDETSEGPIHACNYLADGLVFSKNGRSLTRPWVVDRLTEVVAGYRKSFEISVRYYRQKKALRRAAGTND